jgi:hypothetical protein
MPGSLARPPNHEHRDREDRRKLTGVLAEELEEDQGGDTVSTATVVVAQHHRPVGYGDGGAAPCPRPSGQAQHHTWGDAGVADMPSNRRGGGDTAAGAEKRSRNPS